MKNIKILIPLLTLLLIVGVYDMNGQEVKISKEVKKKIKEKEEEIRANEEMLMSGVEGIERTKVKLAKSIKNSKITPEEITKKERILYKVEGRLSLLNKKIEEQKESLNAFKVENNLVAGATASKKTEAVADEAVIKEALVTGDIKARKQRLKEAREKLEEEILEREAAHELEQANLAKLAELASKIKAEEEGIEREKQEAADKILAEKQKKINNIEDDIFVSQEILISGQEGLVRSKERLEKAKTDGVSTPEDIARKASIVDRVEIRLKTIEMEIKEKRDLIKAIQSEE